MPEIIGQGYDIDGVLGETVKRIAQSSEWGKVSRSSRWGRSGAGDRMPILWWNRYFPNKLQSWLDFRISVHGCPSASAASIHYTIEDNVHAQFHS